MGGADVRGEFRFGRAPRGDGERADRHMLGGDGHERVHGASARAGRGARVSDAWRVDGDGRRCEPHVRDDGGDEDGKHGVDRPCGAGDIERALGDGECAWEHEPRK